MNADPTDYEWFADAVAMAVVDGLPRETVLSAPRLSESAAQFNNAIWASCKLKDMMEGHECP